MQPSDIINPVCDSTAQREIKVKHDENICKFAFDLSLSWQKDSDTHVSFMILKGLCDFKIR